ILYLGRTDHQIKLRGQRIELGEIEAALERHAGVSGAVVLVRDMGASGQQLVAYYITTNKEPLPARVLKAFLSGSLPDYMVPNLFSHLKEFLLSANGKIDRKSLHELRLPEEGPGKEYTAPRNPSEEILKEIWQEVLKQEAIGIHDHFFDVGGH